MLCDSFFITFKVAIYTKVCFMVIYLLPLIFYHIFIGYLYLLCPRPCGRHYKLYKDKGHLIVKGCYHPIDYSLNIFITSYFSNFINIQLIWKPLGNRKQILVFHSFVHDIFARDRWAIGPWLRPDGLGKSIKNFFCFFLPTLI